MFVSMCLCDWLITRLLGCVCIRVYICQVHFLCVFRPSMQTAGSQAFLLVVHSCSLLHIRLEIVDGITLLELSWYCRQIFPSVSPSTLYKSGARCKPANLKPTLFFPTPEALQLAKAGHKEEVAKYAKISFSAPCIYSTHSKAIANLHKTHHLRIAESLVYVFFKTIADIDACPYL